MLADVEAEIALVGPVRNEHRRTWAHQGGLQGSAPPPRPWPQPTRRVSGVHPHRDSRACTSQIPSSSAGPFPGAGSRLPTTSYENGPPPPATEAWVQSTWSCRWMPLSRCRRNTSTRAVAGVTTTSPLLPAMPGTATVARTGRPTTDTTTGAPPLSTPSARRSRSRPSCQRTSSTRASSDRPASNSASRTRSSYRPCWSSSDRARSGAPYGFGISGPGEVLEGETVDLVVQLRR